jgi:ribonuclease T2
LGPTVLRSALCLALGLGAAAAAIAAEPARFDYYVLVLSWAPSYCATDEAARRDDPQCDGPHRRFTLHGLWPQYFAGWPRNCWRGERPWVQQNVIESMRDLMPSKGLVIHEYREHGTCAGLSPKQYFAIARQLYERIELPDRLPAATKDVRLTPDEEVETAFLAANPWLRPDMVSVTCRRGALLDVRVCFAPDLSPTRCGKNEERSVCRTRDVTMSPAR